MIEVRNLADALEELHALGYQTIGLDSEGPDILENSITGTESGAGSWLGGQGSAPENTRNLHHSGTS